MSRPTLEVADIVRASGNRFWEHNGSHLAWQHRKVLDAIVRCRTAALGGHRDQCMRCGHQAISYNSCRNRHWTNVIGAMGILNTAQRALGGYTEAFDVAKRSYELAEAHCPGQLGKTARDMARCIALQGGPSEDGLNWASLSLELASNNLDKAKCLLAIGEVQRHTNNPSKAIDAYSESVRWATAVGHYDCLLWAALGLSDSQFVLGEYVLANNILSKVKPIIEDSERHFPLESLHYELSCLTLDIAGGTSKDDQLEVVLGRYEELGVQWSREYISHVKSGVLNVPKKF